MKTPHQAVAAIDLMGPLEGKCVSLGEIRFERKPHSEMTKITLYGRGHSASVMADLCSLLAIAREAQAIADWDGKVIP